MKQRADAAFLKNRRYLKNREFDLYFLGSNPGADPVYEQGAQKMGRQLVAYGLT